MAIYEYYCQKCWLIETVKQSADDREPPVCKKCGKKMKRKYSAPAIHVKERSVYYKK